MMELREKIARAICGNWVVGDDRPWQQWAEEADAVIEVLAQHTASAESLRDALKKANDQAERFEREWYLRGDEIERLRAELETEKEWVTEYREQASRLHLEIEAMKQQKPAAWQRQHRSFGPDAWMETTESVAERLKTEDGWKVRPLYLAPGAKGE